MARRRNPVPSYRLHRQSGQAVVTVRAPDGGRRDVLLGRYGSVESRAEYERILAELRLGRVPDRRGAPAPDITVAEVLARFWDHAQRYYVDPAGRPTSELNNFRSALRPVRHLYAHTPAKEFGPLALKAVRERMVAAGWCRSMVNNSVRRVRQAFKWAVGEELVPVEVHAALAAVAGLRAGRSGAKEAKPVGPVEDQAVDATVPHLNRHVRALVLFVRWTGCRTGEACQLRPCDLDRSGDVWVFRPAAHKTRHHGKGRAIPVGPKARAVLEPLMPADPAAYVFSPAAAVAELHAARSAARKTKLYPSHARRNAGKRTAEPKRPPADRYDTGAVGRAVARAVERANARRLAMAAPGNFDPVPHWHPHQLRHTYATKVRRLKGLEAARAVLGHSAQNVTETYTERDQTLATVAREVG